MPGPFNHSRCFWYDFKDDQCFSFSSDEVRTAADMFNNWSAVDAADRDDVASFAQHNLFEIDLRSNADNIVDGVWVRKWKDRAPGTVKSRCCGLGYLDK